MIQSVNLPPSAHTIQCTLQHTATLCSLQPNIQCTSSAHTTAAITYSVHTAAMYSHVQLSAVNLQCTLQPCTAMYSYLQPIFSAHCSQLQPSTTTYHSVHTAAILPSAHYSYTIQCTLQLYHPVHTTAIPFSAHCSYTI